jgi:WD40 repeat protein
MLRERQAVRAICFSNCGRMLAYGTNSRDLHVFELPPSTSASSFEDEDGDSTDIHEDEDGDSNMKELLHRAHHHAGSIYCIAWSANGRLLATGSNDRWVKLIRMKEEDGGNDCGGGTGAAAATGAAGAAGAAAFKISSHGADDSSLCAEGSKDVPGHDGAVRGLRFMEETGSDGAQLLSVEGGGGSLRVWDILAGGGAGRDASLTSVLDGHSGPVFCVQSPTAGCAGAAWQAITGGGDKTVRVWDLRTDLCMGIIRTTSPVHAVSYHPTNPLLIASTAGVADHACAVWDLRMLGAAAGGDRGWMAPLQQLTHHEQECRSIQFSPDGQWLLTASFDGTATVAKWAEGTPVTTPAASGVTSATRLPVIRTYSQSNARVLQARWHPRLPMLAYSVQGQSGDALVQVDHGL